MLAGMLDGAVDVLAPVAFPHALKTSEAATSEPRIRVQNTHWNCTNELLACRQAIATLKVMTDSSNLHDNDIAGRMRTVIGRLSRRLRHAGGHTDLSPSQYEVFGTIARQGDLRLSDLATIEGINPTLLSRIVAKLEAADLVTREPDPEDRRVSHVAPTDKGREFYEQIRHERTDAVNLAIESLTSDERRALATALPVLESLAKSLKQHPQ